MTAHQHVGAAPDITVAIVGDCLAVVAPALERYLRVERPWNIDVIVALVGSRRGGPRLEPFLNRTITVVDGGEGDLGLAERRALEASTATWVVFAQAHALPEPGYIDAILDATRLGPWTVVGPSFVGGGADSACARAFMHICFGRWTPTHPAGARPQVAAHNSAYRREALAALGSEVDNLLEAGWALVRAVVRNGGSCYYEPRARISMRGPSTWTTLTRHLFRIGRRGAAQRCADWPVWRRAVYAAGTPLIPLLWMWRMRTQADYAHAPAVAARDWPAVIVGLIANAVGECAGFLTARYTRDTFRPPPRH